MHAHISDFEVDIVAQFRLGNTRLLEMIIMGEKIVVTIQKINEMDARASSCLKCNERVKGRKKIFERARLAHQNISMILKIKMNKDQALNFQQRKISIMDILLTKDTPE